MGVIKENFLHHNIIGSYATHAAINMQADGIFYHVGQLQHGGGITRRVTLGYQHRGSNALGFAHGFQPGDRQFQDLLHIGVARVAKMAIAGG